MKNLLELNARESRTLGLLADEFTKLTGGEKVISPIQVRSETDDQGLSVNLQTLRDAAQNKGIYFMEAPDEKVEGAVLLKVIYPPTQEKTQRTHGYSITIFTDFFEDLFGKGLF